jgi:dienelactone hydrolase
MGVRTPASCLVGAEGAGRRPPLACAAVPLGDYVPGEFEADGTTRTVFRRGSGPAVIVIAEMPGITPKVVALADRVVALGCSAVLPQLFGTPGREIGGPYIFRSFVPACVSREFATLATGRTSPVTTWLRALAAAEHQRCGGPGVGAVGMCFTGGFALGMAVDDRLLAPVLSQPSLPFPIGAARKRDVGVSPDDLARVKQRGADDGLCVLGLRFTNDRVVPGERFATLREELGDAFVGVEIDSSPDNPHGIPTNAHSVLTEHFVDEPGHPTRDALDQVLDLFRSRLLTDPGG